MTRPSLRSLTVEIQHHVSEKDCSKYADEFLQRTTGCFWKGRFMPMERPVRLETQACAFKSDRCISYSVQWDARETAGLRLRNHRGVRTHVCTLSYMRCGQLLTSQTCDCGSATSCFWKHAIVLVERHRCEKYIVTTWAFKKTYRRLAKCNFMIFNVRLHLSKYTNGW